MPESFMGITPELVEMVKSAESFVPHPYRDVAGYPTIGYGHRISSMDHRNITEEEGAEYLFGDLFHARNRALELSPNLRDEPSGRLAAITDFIFNLGAGNYATSTLRKRVAAGNWPAAAYELGRWVYATDIKTGRKVKYAGLVRRRAKAASWMVAA